MAENGKKPEFKDLVQDLPDELKQFKIRARKEIQELINDRKFNDVIEKGREALAKLPDKAVGVGDKGISDIFLMTATAIRELQGNTEEVRNMAMKAAEFDRTSKGAMWLVRDLRNEKSSESKFYLMECTGKSFAPTTEGIKEFPFKTVYGVVADNPEEAMNYVREFERGEVSSSMELRDAKEVEEKTDVPKGVYSTMALVAKFKTKE
mgnify:CR=1 FL=1